jgi:hypothetical protein
MARPAPDPVLSAVGRLAQAQRKDRVLDPTDSEQVAAQAARIARARRGLLRARTERAIRDALNPPDTDYAPLPVEDRRLLADILLEESA